MRMSSTEEGGADLPGESRAAPWPVSLHRPCFFRRASLSLKEKGGRRGRASNFPPTEERGDLLPRRSGGTGGTEVGNFFLRRPQGRDLPPSRRKRGKSSCRDGRGDRPFGFFFAAFFFRSLSGPGRGKRAAELDGRGRGQPAGGCGDTSAAGRRRPPSFK